MIQVLRAKLHGIFCTEADLNYKGSVTLDPLFCEAAGIYPLEFVDIWNKTTGARFYTYVIYGKKGSGCCVLNGSAARLCQKGDELIIAASSYINDPKELYDMKPTVLTFDQDNTVTGTIYYDVYESPEQEFNFRMM